MIVDDALKAIGQIPDGRFIAVLAKGIALSIFFLAALTAAFSWTVGLIIPDSFSLPWIGEIGWIDNLASAAVIPVMLVASIFLMVPVAAICISFLLDSVVDAVERRHYPNAPKVAPLPFSAAFGEGLRFLGLFIVVNLLALLLYLTPLAPFVFWGVNGMLLGREYATLVAQRRLGRAGARKFRGSNRMAIWGLGILMAIPLSVPALNLAVPILGAAAFTHLVHRLS